MWLRKLSFSLLLLSLVAPFQGRAESSANVQRDETEAKELLKRAEAYVTNIAEGDYSYAYIQFYWKRAQANIDRILRVYPQSAAARTLQATDSKLGPYEPTYFKERVLARLEEKRLAAYDAVNCAIFLYNLDETRQDRVREDTMASIIEVIARQKRWGEALDFPVLQQSEARKLSTIFRVAARYDEKAVVQSLLTRAADTLPAVVPELWAIQGEADALLGKPREAIARFLDEHSQPEVKLAVLRGMVTREIAIQRAAALRIPVNTTITEVHYYIGNLTVRDNVESVAATFFPAGNKAATDLLSIYKAGLGTRPAANASEEAHRAYMVYLSETENYKELLEYSPAARGPLALHRLFLLAKAGRLQEANDVRARLLSAAPALGDAAELAQFNGRSQSIVSPYTVRDRAFSSLAITDPCLVAQAIMEWSLTPTRSIRGAAPYDSVVQKFSPGFVNLAAPKSSSVRDAASTLKPY